VGGADVQWRRAALLQRGEALALREAGRYSTELKRTPIRGSGGAAEEGIGTVAELMKGIG